MPLDASSPALTQSWSTSALENKFRKSPHRAFWKRSTSFSLAPRFKRLVLEGKHEHILRLFVPERVCLNHALELVGSPQAAVSDFVVRRAWI